MNPALSANPSQGDIVDALVGKREQFFLTHTAINFKLISYDFWREGMDPERIAQTIIATANGSPEEFHQRYGHSQYSDEELLAHIGDLVKRATGSTGCSDPSQAITAFINNRRSRITDAQCWLFFREATIQADDLHYYHNAGLRQGHNRIRPGSFFKDLGNYIDRMMMAAVTSPEIIVHKPTVINGMFNLTKTVIARLSPSQGAVYGFMIYNRPIPSKMKETQALYSCNDFIDQWNISLWESFSWLIGRNQPFIDELGRQHDHIQALASATNPLHMLRWFGYDAQQKEDGRIVAGNEALFEPATLQVRFPELAGSQETWRECQVTGLCATREITGKNPFFSDEQRLYSPDILYDCRSPGDVSLTIVRMGLSAKPKKSEALTKMLRAAAIRANSGQDNVVRISDANQESILGAFDVIKNLGDLVAERTAQYLAQKQVAETALEELKATQAELVRMERLAASGTLVSHLNHEIMNPLTTISKALDTVSRNLGKLREGEGYDRLESSLNRNLGYLSGAVSRIQELTKNLNEMITLKRALKKRVHLSTYLGEPLDECIASYPLLQGVNLVRRFGYAGECVVTDYVRSSLSRIIENIAQEFGRNNRTGNHITAVTGDDGAHCYFEITSPTKFDLDNYRAQILKSADPEERTAYVGMSEDELLQTVFEPFTSTKKTAGKGTGMGLYLVEQTAESLKTRVEARRTDSTFTVRMYLPKGEGDSHV